jgi:FtsH-binding integral membrane protein
MFSWNPDDASRYDTWDGQRDQGRRGWDLRGTGAREMAGVQDGSLTASFVWMFLALLVSAAAAFLTLANPGALQVVEDDLLVFVIAELALVFILSAAIDRLSSSVAVLMLFVYAALTGATFAMVLDAFSLGSVTTAFVGAAALYGIVTGRDLTSLGGLLFAGLIGIVVASLANIFIGGDELSFIIGIVGVVLFTGLTAYDIQRIKDGRMAWVRDRENASVLGALALYLDFVNIFEMLLRLTGSRRR